MISQTTSNEILLCICSCASMVDRHQVLYDTWMNDIPENIRCVFYMGLRDDGKEIENCVQLNVDDTYKTISRKVLKFYEYALQNYEFDWLFRCDLDTYVDLSRLPQLCTKGADFIGNDWISSRGFPQGGAGYMLSRDLVKQIVALQDTIPTKPYEDVLIGGLALKLCENCHVSTLLNAGSHPCPLSDNEMITAHWVTEEKMRIIHQLRYSKKIFTCKVKHKIWKWEGLLDFYEGGVRWLPFFDTNLRKLR